MTKKPLKEYIEEKETIEEYLTRKVGSSWVNFPKSSEFQLKVLKYRNKDKFGELIPYKPVDMKV